jgi:predicted Rossmann fold flavoprotein
MSGAKLECEVTLLRNHAKERTYQGDILFTAYGISGFAVLDISRDASIALQNFEHVLLSLNLLPRFNRQHLAEHIQSVAKKAPDLSIFEMLQGLLPTKIALHFLEAHAIEVHATLRTLDTKLSKKIAAGLQDWRFEVSDTHGFRHAEVSGGGVNTDEVDPKTYESKKQKNLYFCGEVLDIVGERGGYNFAFAWASAYAAAKAITARS